MNTDFMTTDTEDMQMIRESARNFAEKNIRPHIMEWDEAQHFPKDLFHKMGEQGFMGILVPEKYGGSDHHVQKPYEFIGVLITMCNSSTNS